MSVELGPLTAFLLGLLWGSFANVVIYRLPLKKNVAFPRSRCRTCEKQISWYDNIPVLSWLFLKGRCRHCGKRISAQYPLVEALMAFLFTGIFFRFGYSWLTLEYAVLCWGLVTVSFIDLDHMVLPDRITLPGIIVGLGGALLNPERDFTSAFLGALMGGGFLWLIAYLYFVWRKAEGMGGGDIKLLAWIGAVLGWKSIPFVILSASIVGSLVGVLLLIRRDHGLKSVIPFGPYLSLGAILYLFGGEAIGAWYISLFLPAFSPVN